MYSVPYADAWAELGASYIYGSDSGSDSQVAGAGNPVTTIADLVSLPRMAVDPDSQVVYGASAQPLGQRSSQQLQSWLSDFTALVSNATANLSLADVAGQLVQALELSADSQQLLQVQLAAGLELRYRGPLDQLSALYYDNSSSFPGVDDLVTGGYSQVVDWLAEGLTDIRLNSPVAGISHSDSLAMVNLTTGESLTAQYVVCTVPLGVLKAGMLALDPPLPEESEAAVGALGFGLVNRVFLYFEQASSGHAGFSSLPPLACPLLGPSWGQP